MPAPDTSVASAFDAVRDLIQKAVADPRFAALGAQLEASQAESAQADRELLLESLRREMASRGVDVSEVLQPFEQVLSVLDSATGDEPPEEWKAWLEGLMRNPPPEFAAILSQLKEPPEGKKETAP